MIKIVILLAWRNLWRNKRRTIITISSILFAVLLACALLSLAGGFRNQMMETMIRQETGFLQIQDAMYMEKPSMDHLLLYDEELKNTLNPYNDDIRYTVPRIRGFSLAAKDYTSKPAVVTGILPHKEEQLRNLSANISRGRMFSPHERAAIIGSGLARMLDLDLEDTLILLGQGFRGMSASGKFTVTGIIEHSMPEQNNTTVFLPLEQAQWYFAAENRLTGLILMIHDPQYAPQLAEKLNHDLDSEWYAARTWQELIPEMAGLMEMQKTVYTMIAWVFYIIVGFGIFGTILNMLFERTREFGILLSLGMKRMHLSMVCLTETIIIGFLGVLAGTAAGVPVVLFFQAFPIKFSGDMADYILKMGMEPVFPFIFDFRIFMEQALSIFIITLIIGLYSMYRIFRISITEAAKN